jgi:hypothetical protein
MAPALGSGGEPCGHRLGGPCLQSGFTTLSSVGAERGEDAFCLTTIYVLRVRTRHVDDHDAVRQSW